TDQDGVGRVDARLAPDDFARFCSAIRTEANAVFHEARKSGRREPSAAYEADALVALVTGTNVTTTTASSTTTRPTSVMHLRVDLAALRRGELEEGETCEIPGVGPVPLATASHVLGDSLLKVIIGDGVDVTNVCHLGRAVPAHIRSALEDRDEKCVVPGCDVAKGLEIDHYQIAFQDDGPTELWNLCRLCRWHHHLKSHCDYAITGEPGSWEWHGPESDRSPVLTS
ncbi:MAG TPA: HNH endonuclease signature motif containing protein, partial [Acidimicrobiales bacterium]